MIKFRLRRGHRELFGEDTLLSHREAADKLENYMYKKGLMIDLRRKPYNSMSSDLVAEIFNRREILIGDYMDVVDPNYIINLPWMDTGKLSKPKRYNDPNYMYITASSIKTHGIFVPIIVGALPEWHPYWKHPTKKFFKTYNSKCTFIIEGRHRTYTAISTGINLMQAFILDPVEV